MLLWQMFREEGTPQALLGNSDLWAQEGKEPLCQRGVWVQVSAQVSSAGCGGEQGEEEEELTHRMQCECVSDEGSSLSPALSCRDAGGDRAAAHRHRRGGALAHGLTPTLPGQLLQGSPRARAGTC